MIADIREMVVDTRSYTGVAALDEKVMQAMAVVPRHEFVPPPLREFAYLNNPLPIGAGQTISQPYIVALMTHLMNVDKDATVLEVGTGSGLPGGNSGAPGGAMFTPSRSSRRWAGRQRIPWRVWVLTT